MFRHLLVPTDGTKLSTKAIKAAVKLAGRLDANLTAVHIVPPYSAPVYGDVMMPIPEFDPKEYRKATEAAAMKALAVAEREAAAAGLRCDTMFLADVEPWKGILKAAKKAKCDGVVMASHGRKGIAGLLLGSETMKVLTHSSIPVVVVR